SIGAVRGAARGIARTSKNGAIKRGGVARRDERAAFRGRFDDQRPERQPGDDFIAQRKEAGIGLGEQWKYAEDGAAIFGHYSPGKLGVRLRIYLRAEPLTQDRERAAARFQRAGVCCCVDTIGETTD